MAVYIYEFTPHWAAFLDSSHLHNRFLQIDYRAMIKPGVTYFDFVPGFSNSYISAGIAPEHDAYLGGFVQDDIRASCRLNFGIKLTDELTVEPDFLYTPLIRDFSSFRIYAALAFHFKITPTHADLNRLFDFGSGSSGLTGGDD